MYSATRDRDGGSLTLIDFVDDDLDDVVYEEPRELTAGERIGFDLSFVIVAALIVWMIFII